MEKMREVVKNFVASYGPSAFWQIHGLIWENNALQALQVSPEFQNSFLSLIALGEDGKRRLIPEEGGDGGK